MRETGKLRAGLLQSHTACRGRAGSPTRGVLDFSATWEGVNRNAETNAQRQMGRETSMSEGLSQRHRERECARDTEEEGQRKEKCRDIDTDTPDTL